jgi:pantoate--beta-alanine ligase
LTPTERAEAPQLNAALREIVVALQSGNRDYTALEAKAQATLCARRWRVDYVAIRRQLDLLPPIAGDHALVVLGAARIGATRLIDNLEVFL